MGVIDFFFVASMPVLKVLFITFLGSFLATEGVDILGENARKCLNTVVFYVFTPALVGSNLAGTLTWDSLALLWYMPVNILITFVIGSALGWILLKITKAPRHLHGLVLGTCSAGNVGNLFLILIPAMCKEKSSPFGEPGICYSNSMAYASLSNAITSICIWTYVYNIVRVSSTSISNELISSSDESDDIEEPLLTNDQIALPNRKLDDEEKVLISVRIQQQLTKIQKTVDFKALFAPSTIGALIGFTVGLIPLLRKLLIAVTAPLRVVEDSASLIGNAAIPTMTLIIGGNLLKGLKGSGVKLSIILGIIVVRYVLLPVIGVVVVKGAIHFGLVQADPLYQFVLLLQFAVPPAMNIGTITQLFGTGESECSVIMLWTYALASVALTLWSTLFLWIVA